MSLPEWQRPAWERGRFLFPYLEDRYLDVEAARQRLARAARRLDSATKRGTYYGDGLARLARSVPVLRREVRELAIECRARAGHRPTVARCTWVAQIRALRKEVRWKMEWLEHLWSQCESNAEAIRRGVRADGRPYSSRAVLRGYAKTVRDFPELYTETLAALAAKLAMVRTYDEFQAARGQRAKGHLRLAWSRQLEGVGA